MKKGAALSLVLAPGGTPKFCVTQAGWASAIGAKMAAASNAAVAAANRLVMFLSPFERQSADA